MKNIIASLAIITALFSAQTVVAQSLSAQSLSSVSYASANSNVSSSQQNVSKVNINSAGTSELAAALKGVGIKKAQAIIEYRKKFGDFKSVDELTAVKGIGAKTLAKNRAKITL